MPSPFNPSPPVLSDRDVEDFSISKRRLFAVWVWRLFGYDGLMPALVLLVPAVLMVTFGKRGHIEFIAVVLPIMAFLIRGALGLRNINANTCPKPFKILQRASLFLGLIALLLVDSFMILSWSLPAKALGQQDYQTAALIYACYLILMAVASFPGFAKRDMKS